MSIKDVNNIPEFLKIMESLEKNRIEVGIFGEDDSEMLMIARVNEFGVKIEVTKKMRNYLHAMGLHLSKNTRHIEIPERSFLRNGFDENKQKIENEGAKLLQKVILMQLPVKTFYEVLGEYIVGLIRIYLTELKDPANHPFTIKRKKSRTSSNPLIDTGRLRDSITYKITS
jgi:phage gpG-like protein